VIATRGFNARNNGKGVCNHLRYQKLALSEFSGRRRKSLVLIIKYYIAINLHMRGYEREREKEILKEL